jgi:hypothetical protein
LGLINIQRVIEMHSENFNGDKTRQNKLLFYLPFFRKIFLNPDKILINLIVNSGPRVGKLRTVIDCTFLNSSSKT